MRTCTVSRVGHIGSLLSLLLLSLLLTACNSPSADPDVDPDLEDPIVEDPIENEGPSYTIIYAALAGGDLQGKTVQSVAENAQSTAVTAVPSTGFVFDGWSDGVTAASRTDVGSAEDMSVQAHFRLNADYAPWLLTGHFGSLSVHSIHASGATIDWPNTFSGGSYNLYVSHDASAVLSDYQVYDVTQWADVAPGFQLTDLTYGEPTYIALEANGEVVSWTSFTPRRLEPNKEIHAAVAGGNGIRYVGGDFSHFGLVSGSGFLTPLSGSDHPLVWPTIVGDETHSAEIRSVISDDKGGWYVGGDFTWVDSQPSLGLTHIDSAGQVSGWLAQALSVFDSASVSALALGTDGEVYVAGWFREVTDEAMRTHYLIALDSSTGELKEWHPHLNREVNALAFRDGLLYVGGHFTHVDESERQRLAVFDMENKQLLDWPAGVDGTVHALLAYDDKIFVGGDFNRSSDGHFQPNLMAFDSSGQAFIDWPKDGAVRGEIETTVRSLGADRGVVYTGGENLIVNGELRNLLAVNLRGEVMPWRPQVEGRVDALAARQGVVYVGGDVTSDEQRYLLALDENAELTSWSPRPDGPIKGLTIAHDTVAAVGLAQVVHAKQQSHLAALDADEKLLDWQVDIYNTPSCINKGLPQFKWVAFQGKD